MRRTKIIATIGPAIESPEMLEAMIKAGVAIFRLNMSHAKHDWVRKVVQDIRDVCKRINQPAGIMMDTQGPEIRTGEVAGQLDLKPGERFTFTVRGAISQEEKSIDINYDDMVNDIEIGDVVLIDSGLIRMKVLSKEAQMIKCEVLTPGTLTSRRHINLPGVRVNLPALTAKDIKDVTLATELKLDFIALSFVREAQDVLTLKALLKANCPDHMIRIISKIEDQSAVKNLNEIIEVSDGIMVARGDLGIECPFEDLTIIQRNIVSTCLAKKKRVIVATHMLESMIQNPLPTRAEITDVSNAVREQADAIMLSGETTVGKYPIECVKIMDRIASRVEADACEGFAEQIKISNHREAIVWAAVQLANKVTAKAIIVFTRNGRMGSLAGAFRPKTCPIYAFSPNEETVLRLTLRWGILPLLLDFTSDREATVSKSIEILLERQYISKGDMVVVISDLVAGEKIFDSVQLRIA